MSEEMDFWLELSEGLDALTPKQRQAFGYWYLGFTQKEAAILLGVSRQAVGYRLMAAFKKLHEFLP